MMAKANRKSNRSNREARAEKLRADHELVVQSCARVLSVVGDTMASATERPQQKTVAETLPFTALRDGKALPLPKKGQLGRCFWNIKPTGDYGVDCITGRHFAVDYLTAEERDDTGGPLLALIVADMPRELTGLEVGFLETIGQAAIAGAGYARALSAHYDEMWETKRKPASKSSGARRSKSARA